MALQLSYLTDPINGVLAWAGKLVTDLNGYLAALNGVPTGLQAAWHSATPPTGWLPCDGASYTTTAQPALFAVVGYTYGGAGDNFNVPSPTAGVAHSIIKA